MATRKAALKYYQKKKVLKNIYVKSKTNDKRTLNTKMNGINQSKKLDLLLRPAELPAMAMVCFFLGPFGVSSKILSRGELFKPVGLRIKEKNT